MSAPSSHAPFAPLGVNHMPMTPPVNKTKKRLVNPKTPLHVATPKPKGKTMSALSRTPARRVNSTSKNNAPASTTKTQQTPRSRAKSVGQRPLVIDQLLAWDKHVLAQELIKKGTAVSNLEEDVHAWSKKWENLKIDGQELYKEFINHSERNKRFAEKLTHQRIEIEGLVGEKEQTTKKLTSLTDTLEKTQLALRELEEDKLRREAERQDEVASNVTAAREAALLSRNLSLQEKCNELESAKQVQLDLNTTLQVKVSSLERKILENAVTISHQSPSQEVSLPNSPVRKIESLSIRVEALRARTVDLESKLKVSTSSRQETEKELRSLKQEKERGEEQHAEAIKALELQIVGLSTKYENQIATATSAHIEASTAFAMKIEAMEGILREQKSNLEEAETEKRIYQSQYQEIEQQQSRLMSEIEDVNDRYLKQKNANGTLESDMRLLHQQHKQELTRLDAKYHRQDYKTRYARAQREKQMMEKKLELVMEAMNALPAVSASSDILTSLIAAGVEGIQSQQQILLTRKDTFKLEYEQFKDKELTVNASIAQTEALHEYQQKIERLETAKKDAVNRCQELEEEVQLEQMKKEELQTQVSANKMNQSVEYEDRINKLKQRMEGQTQTIQSLRAHIETLESTIATTEAALEENEFVQTEMQESMEESEASLEIAKAERSALAAIVEKQTNALESATIKLDEFAQRYATVSEEKNELYAQNRILCTDLENITSAWKGAQVMWKSEHDHRKQSKQQLRQQICELQEEHERKTLTLQHSLVQRESAFDQLVGDKEAAYALQSDEIVSLEQKLATAMQHGGTELAKSRDQLREVEEKFEAASSQVSKLTEELHQATALAELCTTRQAAAEAQVSELSQKMVNSQSDRPPLVLNGDNKLLSLWQHHQEVMKQHMESANERVAREKAKSAALSLKVENVGDQLAELQVDSRRLGSETRRSALLQQQLLLQLQVLIEIHKRTVATLSANLPSGYEIAANELAELRGEKLDLERKVKVSMETARETAEKLTMVTQDRDAIKESYADAQNEWQERAQRLKDDSWKQIARSQRNLWIKFEKLYKQQSQENERKQ